MKNRSFCLVLFPVLALLLLCGVQTSAETGLPQQPVARPTDPRIPPTDPKTPIQDTLTQMRPDELHSLANTPPVPNDGKTPQQRTQELAQELETLGAKVKDGEKLHAEAQKRYKAEIEDARKRYPNESPEQRKALREATDRYTNTSQDLERTYRQPAQKKMIELANKSHVSEMTQAMKKAGVNVPEQPPASGKLSPAEQSRRVQEQQRLVNDKLNELKNTATQGKTPAERAAARKALQTIDKELQVIQATEGTKSGSAGHRGWEGDTDAGSSAKRSNRVEKIANKMGLTTEGKPGYSNVKGLDLTTHKQGAMGPPGSSTHQTQISVDAQSKETYVSSSMKKGQIGRSHVEVADHTKKALPGLKKTPADLFKSPAELQSMAKGTLKAIEAGRLSDKQIRQIMKDSNIKGTPQQFKEFLKNLKGNGSHAPDGYARNLNAETTRNLQKASAEVLKTAHKNTAKQAKAQISRAETQAKNLEAKAKAAEANAKNLDAQGRKAEAQKARDLAGKLKKNAQAKRSELIDSKTRMQQTRDANQATIKGKTPPPDPKTASQPPAKGGRIKVNLGGKTPPSGGSGKVVTTSPPPKGPTSGGVRPKPVKTIAARPPAVTAPVKPGVMRTPIKQIVGPRVTTAYNGAMTILNIYGIYQGVTQGVNDAIAESDAANEGNIKRGLRGGAYAVWYGLGFKGAADLGREEGETFTNAYHAELYLNNIKPNSWEGRKLYVQNKALAIGAALTKLTQLEAAYELGEESVGLAGDLWNWLKAWRAERDMAKRLAAKRKGYLTSRHQQSDWYCTNKPVIDAPVALPPVISSAEEKKP
jgi:hypothetical protein